MRVTVMCDKQGRIVAFSKHSTKKEDEGTPSAGIQPDPNLGHLVYDLDLPEGLEKASDLVSKLRVELRDSPHLVRVQDRDQQAKPR